MKNDEYARIALKMALFYFITAAVCQSIQAQSDIQFRLIGDSIIVVSMKVDEEGHVDFVLDTGADTTIVGRSLATKLSLASLGRVKQTTLVGTQTLTSSSLASLAVGPARVENLPVLVEDLTGMRKVDTHIQGIAGQDFLSHFNYLIDYRKHSVRIEQGNEIRAAIDGDPLPIEASGHRMIIASEAQSVGRANLHFVLDSGANIVVLLPGASQALHISTIESRTLTMTSGEANVKVGRLRSLSVGSQHFHEVAVSLACIEPAERIGDGLLPTALFNSIYVNNHEGFVIFNPHPKKNQSVSARSSPDRQQCFIRRPALPDGQVQPTDASIGESSADRSQQVRCQIVEGA